MVQLNFKCLEDSTRVLDNRKRLIGIIDHIDLRVHLVRDMRDWTKAIVFERESHAQKYFKEFNWKNIIGKTDGLIESRVIITKPVGPPRHSGNSNRAKDFTHNVHDRPYNARRPQSYQIPKHKPQWDGIK